MRKFLWDEPKVSAHLGDRPTQEVPTMQAYVIRRRSAWSSPDELGEAAARSRQIGDEEMPDEVRWIRSYVVREADGTLGTHCIYQATSPEAIREHAARVLMPADEIEEVVETVVVRPDPAEALAE